MSYIKLIWDNNFNLPGALILGDFWMSLNDEVIGDEF